MLINKITKDTYIVRGYLALVTVAALCFLSSILTHEYQTLIKTFGLALLVLSGFWVYWLLKDKTSLEDCIFAIGVGNVIFLLAAYLTTYDVGGPKNYFKIGFTYSNFWDFYYQLLLAADKSYLTIASGYFPLAWTFSDFFAQVDGWSGAGPEIKWSTKIMYFMVFGICMSSFLLFFNDLKGKFTTKNAILIILFIAISYPILFAYERGNFVIISLFFLTPALYAYWKNNIPVSIIFFALFFSMKTVNLILLPTFIRFFGIRYTVYLSVLILTIQIASLFYVTGGLSQAPMFGEALFAPFWGVLSSLPITFTSAGFQQNYIATDGGRLQGITNLDTIRVLFHTIIYDVRLNIISITTNLQILYNVIGLTGVSYYFIKNWKVGDIYAEIIAILSLMMFAQSSSAEYNLILLYPAVMILLLTGKWQQYKLGLKSLILMTVSMGSLPIYMVQVYPDADLFIAAGVKALWVPYFLVVSFFIFSTNQKTVNQSD